MKWLIINEKYIEGGTEVQTHREIKSMKARGHECYLLTFDEKYPEVMSFNPKINTYNMPAILSNKKKIYHRLFRDKKIEGRIRELINGIEPDYIHINNVRNYPLDVYCAINGYKTFQTIRDYAVICPKETCIHEDHSICLGYKRSNCIKCVYKSPHYIFNLVSLLRINRFRKKYVHKFISPSKALADCCSANRIPTSTVNNQFDFTIINENRDKKEKKCFFYYGKICEIKGVTLLCDAFSEFRKTHPTAELIIAGKIDRDYKDVFSVLQKRIAIKYIGQLSYNEIMDLYPSIYCVVVPSIWIENYPNTVLEAIANKTIVIGTNRGGIPEQIVNDTLLFDISGQRSIIDKMELVWNLSSMEYSIIVENLYNHLLQNNNEEKYIERLLDICQGTDLK